MKAIKGKIVTENVIFSGYLVLDGGKMKVHLAPGGGWVINL